MSTRYEAPTRARSDKEVCEYCFQERVAYSEHRKAGKQDATWETPEELLSLACICGPTQSCRDPICGFSKTDGRKGK